MEGLFNSVWGYAGFPWSQEVPAGIARRLTEEELLEGGEMGQPQGVGIV